MASDEVRYKPEPFNVGTHGEHRHPTNLHWVGSMGESDVFVLIYWDAKINLLLQCDQAYPD